jgi:pyruvate dehydrogenase E1 component alpha subunit
VLEALTYRYRGHSVADAGLAYRTRDEITEEQARDPLVRTRSALRDAGIDDNKLDDIDERVGDVVADAVEFAKASPEPAVDMLAAGVHARGAEEQFARMRPGSPFGETSLVFEGGLGA